MSSDTRSEIKLLCDQLLGTKNSVGLTEQPGNDLPDEVFNLAVAARELLTENDRLRDALERIAVMGEPEQSIARGALGV